MNLLLQKLRHSSLIRLATSWLPLVCLVMGMTGCQTAAHRSNQDCATDECHQGTGDCRESSSCSFELGSIYSHFDETCIRPDDCGFASVAAPPGTYVNQWNDAMICSARRYDFVISRHEWFSGGEQLGPEARQDVAKIAEVLPERPERVIIEAEPTEIQSRETYEEALARTARLNERRRLTIVNNLTERGVEDAELRVMIAPIDRVGVRGIEAPRVYNSLFFGGGGGRGGQRGGGGGQGGGGFGGGGGGGFGGGF